MGTDDFRRKAHDNFLNILLANPSYSELFLSLRPPNPENPILSRKDLLRNLLLAGPGHGHTIKALRAGNTIPIPR